jgi:hypothetical protein
VYEQIEQLCKSPKSQRSRSFSRNDKPLGNQDLPNPKDGTPTRSRFSSESGMTTVGSMPASNQGTRSSFEKGRAMKIFRANSRSSIDREGDSSQISHKKSESFLGENSRQTSGYFVVEPATVEVRFIYHPFSERCRLTIHRTKLCRKSSMI